MQGVRRERKPSGEYLVVWVTVDEFTKNDGTLDLPAERIEVAVSLEKVRELLKE